MCLWRSSTSYTSERNFYFCRFKAELPVFMTVQTTGVGSTSSRSRTHYGSVSWLRSWRDCVCLANSQAMCLHPVPSPRCWMSLWTTTPPPLRAPAPSALHPPTAPSSQNPHRARNVGAIPIAPQTEERTGHPGTRRSPC